jgi:hypothetical protein
MKKEVVQNIDQEDGVFLESSLKHCFSLSHFREIGFFNEADTLESSSILIYSHLRQDNLYTARLVG